MISYKIKERPRKSKYRLSFNIGDRFCQFTAIDDKFYVSSTSKHLHVKCKCSCGQISYQRCDHLSVEKHKSCLSRSQIMSGKKFPTIGYIPGKLYKDIRKRMSEAKSGYLSQEYLNELFIKQEGKCALSKVNLETGINSNCTASLDRIDSSKNYIKGNVQWLHIRVNIMKGNMKEKDFIGICNLISINNIQDNFDPSLLNEYSFNVSRKEQRLEVEDIQTNNTSTSAQQPTMK